MEKGGTTPWKFDSETIFIYDGWSILEERTTNAAGDKTIRRYVDGPVPDEIVRQDYFSSDGSIKSVYHHHDLLGSNLCLSDTTGNAVEYYRYTAFGFPTILDTNLNAIPFPIRNTQPRRHHARAQVQINAVVVRFIKIKIQLQILFMY